MTSRTPPAPQVSGETPDHRVGTESEPMDVDTPQEDGIDRSDPEYESLLAQAKGEFPDLDLWIVESMVSGYLRGVLEEEQ